MTTWYCVTSAYYENDNVVAAITDIMEGIEKPGNGLEVLDGGQIWEDWFPCREEAELFVKAILSEDESESSEAG